MKKHCDRRRAKQILSSTRAYLTGNRRWRADSRRARRPTQSLLALGKSGRGAKLRRVLRQRQVLLLSEYSR